MFLYTKVNWRTSIKRAKPASGFTVNNYIYYIYFCSAIYYKVEFKIVKNNKIKTWIWLISSCASFLQKQLKRTVKCASDLWAMYSHSIMYSIVDKIWMTYVYICSIFCWLYINVKPLLSCSFLKLKNLEIRKYIYILLFYF